MMLKLLAVPDSRPGIRAEYGRKYAAAILDLDREFIIGGLSTVVAGLDPFSQSPLIIVQYISSLLYQPELRIIAVEPRSCVLAWSTFSSIQGENVLIPRTFCT